MRAATGGRMYDDEQDARGKVNRTTERERNKVIRS